MVQAPPVFQELQTLLDLKINACDNLISLFEINLPPTVPGGPGSPGGPKCLELFYYIILCNLIISRLIISRLIISSLTTYPLSTDRLFEVFAFFAYYSTMPIFSRCSRLTTVGILSIKLRTIK